MRIISGSHRGRQIFPDKSFIQTPQEAHACDCRRIEHRAEDQHGAGDRAVVVDEVKQHDHAGSQA